MDFPNVGSLVSWIHIWSLPHQKAKGRMKTVKIKCPSCNTDVRAVQYERCKKIQVFCSDCDKGFTVNLRKGCGIPLLITKEK